MKRWIHATTYQYNVLNQEEVKLLSDAANEGSEYGEWSSWEKALSEIGHKYLEDPDEYAWFEQNSEQLYKVDQVDKLIAYELKNHEVYDITTDDDDFEDEDDDNAAWSDTFYAVMRGEKSPAVDGAIDYDSDDYLIDDITLEDVLEDIEDDEFSDEPVMSVWKCVETNDNVSCELVKVIK